MVNSDNEIDILVSVLFALMAMLCAAVVTSAMTWGILYGVEVIKGHTLPPESVWLWLKTGVPALLVYLWLPLLLLAGTVMGVLNAFFQAIGWAQWFIKRGNAHPFEVLGMVASVIVFVGAVVWQGISNLITQ